MEIICGIHGALFDVAVDTSENLCKGCVIHCFVVLIGTLSLCPF
jgi:hypothetical protein